MVGIGWKMVELTRLCCRMRRFTWPLRLYHFCGLLGQKTGVGGVTIRYDVRLAWTCAQTIADVTIGSWAEDLVADVSQ